MKVYTQRYYFDLTEQGSSPSSPGVFVIRDIYPIDLTGALLCVENDSASNATIVIEESTDGVTWTLVLFSTHSTAGNLSYTIVPRGRGAFLFVSASKYVRFSGLDADGNPVRPGVKCWLLGYPPDPGRAEGY